MRSTLKPLALLMILLTSWPGIATAEQPATDTNAPFAVAARLNMRLVYPRFLFFRVGTAGAAVNLLTFTAAAGAVGNSTPVAATGGTALGGTALDIEVRGNNGQVTITANNSSGGLGLGTGVVADGRINYNQIATTSSTPLLPAPALTNAGGTTAQPALNSALVTQQAAQWSYAYLNNTVPSAGTYGGTVAARGGQVTYTATMP
jgi:hypothetical protein